MCLDTTQKDTWRLGYSHPAALQSCLSPPPCAFAVWPPDGRAASSETAAETKQDGNSRGHRQPPVRADTRAAGTAAAACCPKPGGVRRQRDRSPDGQRQARGSRAFLETHRNFACVVICNLIYGDVRKKDDIGAVGGGATI